MKSKEEVIKEKWIEIIGKEKYNSLMGKIDCDGWYFKYLYDFVDTSGMDLKNQYFDGINGRTLIDTYRPKSLQGIDDNFGWISINSEKDLPNTEQLTYDVCCTGNRILEDVSLKALLSLNESKILTHYSIHEKRLIPLHK